jgi:NADPH-dependent ferric siderophore reductase
MVERVAFPATSGAIRVCVAGESTVTVAIRKYLEHKVGLPKSAMYTVPYWKHSATEEEYHRERHDQMDAMEAV